MYAIHVYTCINFPMESEIQEMGIIFRKDWCMHIQFKDGIEYKICDYLKMKDWNKK